MSFVEPFGHTPCWRAFQRFRHIWSSAETPRVRLPWSHNSHHLWGSSHRSNKASKGAHYWPYKVISPARSMVQGRFNRLCCRQCNFCRLRCQICQHKAGQVLPLHEAHFALHDFVQSAQDKKSCPTSCRERSWATPNKMNQNICSASLPFCPEFFTWWLWSHQQPSLPNQRQDTEGQNAALSSFTKK